MRVKYIVWNYGKSRQGDNLHLVRLINGQGLLLTDFEMVKNKLADWK